MIRTEKIAESVWVWELLEEESGPWGGHSHRMRAVDDPAGLARATCWSDQ